MTEKQQKFLDVLFEEAEGDPVRALKIAGYAQGLLLDDYGSLKDEIADA